VSAMTGLNFCLFFFQAEDGIRDFHVTGVQTCALPISIRLPVHAHDDLQKVLRARDNLRREGHEPTVPAIARRSGVSESSVRNLRSEERRVGKRVDRGGRRVIKQKSEQKENKRAEVRTT